jgi:hypothetical protein
MICVLHPEYRDYNYPVTCFESIEVMLGTNRGFAGYFSDIKDPGGKNFPL